MKKAITLIELIIVMSIMGLLAMIALPKLAKSKMVANESAAQANLRIISAAIENYIATRDIYPSAESDLTGANPPYLDRAYCGTVTHGYNYSCTFQSNSYAATATPTSCGHTGAYDFFAVTGGNISQTGC
jgi:prepilin-type N-terminal cleavage/methylation domain-containing protein